ncbi:MAG: hypothetical protein ACM3ZC_00890, partial [Bacteroidota bacterium]
MKSILRSMTTVLRLEILTVMLFLSGNSWVTFPMPSICMFCRFHPTEAEFFCSSRIPMTKPPLVSPSFHAPSRG